MWKSGKKSEDKRKKYVYKIVEKEAGFHIGVTLIRKKGNKRKLLTLKCGKSVRIDV